MINIAQNNLESRLAYTLAQLIDFYGYEPDGETIKVTIKRRELAPMSSMNTANTIRTPSS